MARINSLFTPTQLSSYINDFKSIGRHEFVHLPGQNKIMITSVHGFDHIRKDNIKPKDSGSLLFAYLLAKITNSHFVGCFQENLPDSNYYTDTNIKKFLLTQKKSFSFLFDIHTSHVYRISDVEIGTMYGKTTPHSNVEIIIQNILLYNFLFSENEFFAGIGEDENAQTMIKFCCEKINVPSVQLELNSGIIYEDNPHRYHMHRFAQLLNSISQSILEIDAKYNA